MSTMSVAVIGAGPAGLVATKTLIGVGLDVTCFEMSPYVGGHWKIDNPNGRAAAYESLTTNTSKAMSRLSDYEMPEDWPMLPTHEHLYRWWCDYAEQFELAVDIRLETEVMRVERKTDAWAVVTRDAAAVERTQLFDAVLLASGAYWQPQLPAGIENFSGAYIHAVDYRSPQRPLQTAGKRVLVIGSSNTGCELALELARAGDRQVVMSARSGNWILPKFIDTAEGPVHISTNAQLSHPLDDVPSLIARLPRRAREALFGWLAKRIFARQFGAYAQRLTAAGMPPPPANPLAKRPAVADRLAEALEEGVLRAMPGIERFDGEQVKFCDGSTEVFDAVICATGYALAYPYVDASILDTSNGDVELFMGLMHPQAQNLFVVGVSRPTGGFWPIAEAQAQFIAQLLSGRYRLPGPKQIARLTSPTLKRDSFNPALYGLALREELRRGAV
ncbi:MAG: FAD-dependent oxidoreductase [Pseudomonadota bacterium]